MIDSDVRGHFKPMTVAASPRRFATAVSLCLHAVVFVGLLEAPKPLGLGSDSLRKAVEVELVALDEVAGAPTAAGSFEDPVSRQEAATPAAEETSVDNGRAPQPAAIPTAKIASAPKPPVASIPDSPDTAQKAPSQKTQAASGAMVERRPVDANDSPMDPSAAETGHIHNPPVVAKPDTSEPPRPVAKRPLKDRKPGTEQRVKSGPSAIPGQAGSANAGGRKAAAVATGRNDLLASYIASIRAQIARQQATRAGVGCGQVRVRFNVAADGRLCDVKIEKSDDDALEEEALRIIRRSSPTAPIPPWAGETSLTMSIVMEFH